MERLVVMRAAQAVRAGGHEGKQLLARRLAAYRRKLATEAVAA